MIKVQYTLNCLRIFCASARVCTVSGINRVLLPISIWFFCSTVLDFTSRIERLHFCYYWDRSAKVAPEIKHRLTSDGQGARSSVDNADLVLRSTDVTAHGARAAVGPSVTAADRRQCRRRRSVTIIAAGVTTSADWPPALVQRTCLRRLARHFAARVCHEH